ncbi:hypothetical protein B5X24_HaOG206766 [Helicoverpa armigera]|uniref:Uncharacterized protein n=1 Tax=Helicoverpa armigera TaxID=29058 RepID=A0A2W1BTL1_HELAM|nr:hypothetical protein B5X24_HaOG206766 [Helicoverpa armigera]
MLLIIDMTGTKCNTVTFQTTARFVKVSKTHKARAGNRHRDRLDMQQVEQRGSQLMELYEIMRSFARKAGNSVRFATDACLRNVPLKINQ